MKLTHAIHIGIDSASIAKIEDGEPCIIRTDTLKDKIPMCVCVNRRGAIQVGDSASDFHKNELLRSHKGWNSSSQNAFIEFTRTLGTDKTYFSSNANKEFTSEELLAEVLKALLSFENGHDINAAVITIPDDYKYNQKEAVRNAGKLAGLQQVEFIQESIAATFAYGLDSAKKDGFCLVFNFGNKSFSVSLQKVDEGIAKVIDTEGDNFLGAVNLDFAIVDEIILPYIQENFVIDSILADDNKKYSLRNSMKFYAEEIKIKLSFNDTHNILSVLGDIPGEDDEGEEFELDITITQSDITKAISSLFQRAIDISKSLLERNSLKGSSLDILALVGGSTYSPVLRKMLEEQICKPDTSVDPRTVIVKGAALFASTVDVLEEVRDKPRNKTKIHLEVGFEPYTVEEEEFVTIKILDDITEGDIPEKVFAEVTKADKTWSSGKVEISSIGEVIEVMLIKGEKNKFEVLLFDEKGKRLVCQPSTFNILQLEEWQVTKAILPYNMGIEVKDKQTGKLLFKTIKGLEKSQSLPATGIINGFKTDKPIRPGVESDFIKIPLFQGEYGCDGSKITHNHHVNTIILTGDDLPSLLPENSTIDFNIKVDINQKITASVYFPSIDFSVEAEVRTNHSSISIEQVENFLFELTENEVLTGKEFKKYFEKLSELKKKNDLDELVMIREELKNYGRKA